MSETTLDETEETFHAVGSSSLSAKAPSTHGSSESTGKGETEPPGLPDKTLSGNERRDVVVDRIEAARLEEEPPREHKRFSKYIWWIIAAAFLIITIVISNYLLNRKKTVSTTESEAATSDTSMSSATLSPEQRAGIAVEIVQKHPIQADMTAPGKVAFNGNRVTPVFSQFNGRLVRLDAEVGATVRRGQVIGMIDTPDIVSIGSDYQQALTTERSARTALDLATRTRERAERLASAEAIPKRELQQAQADESRARDDFQRAQTAIAAARGRLQSAGMSDEEINRITVGARAVNRLVPLIAPIGGTITERKSGLGQVVQPATGDPLFVIADLSSVWVNADIYEDQLAKIRVGSPVKIQTPAYPGESFVARVDQIGSTIDADKHTVAVRCKVLNYGGRLKPGMFASIILTSAAPQTALTVPAFAIVTEGDHRFVLIEDAPGRYTKRPVEIGGETEGSVIIRAGLVEGERVVVRGGLLLSAWQQGQ